MSAPSTMALSWGMVSSPLSVTSSRAASQPLGPVRSTTKRTGVFIPYPNTHTAGTLIPLPNPPHVRLPAQALHVVPGDQAAHAVGDDGDVAVALLGSPGGDGVAQLAGREADVLAPVVRELEQVVVRPVPELFDQVVDQPAVAGQADEVGDDHVLAQDRPWRELLLRPLEDA